ncbi:hypothetical protein E2C01_074510 [Portunus trituberculatus]|uniref:Uncharacterized protein n=1 Tax=Portunus trituberculatus TaxID=210409 RepID=A0A5B7I5U0_PORTR|nr:hypothetical protein [Portunus trituberculatus]
MWARTKKSGGEPRRRPVALPAFRSRDLRPTTQARPERPPGSEAGRVEHFSVFRSLVLNLAGDLATFTVCPATTYPPFLPGDLGGASG